MNTPIRKYISSNTFNTGSLTATAGNTSTGYLRLDIDNPCGIKILEFDKAKFDSTKELQVVTGSTAYFSTG